MFLAGKAVYSGIVFLLLTTWISGPRPAPPTSGDDLNAEAQVIAHADDINKVQQTLQDKGHYRGKIDGVIGLRTRASIRAYQKADNLPVTGHLDVRTAGKLGVAPEAHEEIGSDAAQEKPSAGIPRVKGSLRNGRRPPRPAKE